MRFINNSCFEKEFENITDIRFYPYIGETYQNQERKIMIFAHNIYVPIEQYDLEQERTKSKTHFADALGEYTYQLRWWTKSWRNFIKASTGTKFNYTTNSDKETVDKIDAFVKQISYTNYINDLVKSNKANNVNVPIDLIKKSNRINTEILDILGTTHCVCWGKQVYNHILKLEEFELCKTENYSKKGFQYAQLKNKRTGNYMHVLKVFHPSMPGFGAYNDKTHEILTEFYSK